MLHRFRIKYLQNDKTNEKNKSEEITKEFISLQRYSIYHYYIFIKKFESQL